MKICMVGQGAFAKKHLEGLKRIKDAEVISVYGRTAETTEATAQKYGIPHWTTNFECFIEIGCPMRDAVLLGGGFGCFSSPAINTDDFRVFDALESFQMLLGKRTLPNHTNLHCLPPYKNPFVEKPNILARNSRKRARDLL